MPRQHAISPSLPAEILQEIFSYLSRRDLVNAVIASKWHALNGCMILYRSIDLRSDDRHIDQTVDLLCKCPTLSKRILHAILTTRGPRIRSGGPWISAEVFRHSKNLRSLELRGFPFPVLQDRSTFNDILRDVCTNLRDFTFRPMTEQFPLSGFQVDRLKRVAWHTELELRSAPILTPSVATLTHISFLGCVVHNDGNPYEEFLSLRFPHLLSLGLGSLIQSNLQTNITVTRFLQEHPLLEHLSLGRQRLDDHFFQLHPPFLSPDFLPRLQRFEGFPENLAVMIGCRVRSIFEITYLSLRSTKSNFEDMQELNHILQTAQLEGVPGIFASVEHLRFMFKVPFNHLAIATTSISLAQRRWINWMGHICPNTVTWFGTLPPVHEDALGSTFAFNRNLETISLPQTTLIYADPLTLPRFFSPLARMCPRLERVIARKSIYSEVEDRIYTLRRYPTSDLISVAVEVTRDTTWMIPSPI